MANLRTSFIRMKADPNCKDTRALIIEAKAKMRGQPINVAAVFEHKGLDVAVYADTDVDDLVNSIERNDLEGVRPLTRGRERQGPNHILDSDYVVYTCDPKTSQYLHPQ